MIFPFKRILPHVKRVITYSLLLYLIYPASPVLFDKFLSLKEPHFICPVKIEGDIPIRYDSMGDGHFHARRSGGRRKHKGIDILGKVGTPVYASKSGLVKTGIVPRGMGKYVKIAHIDNHMSVYGHLSKVTVEDKTWVWRGQKIGEIGKTGNANYRNMKPHLHFEIRDEGKAKDPMTYLTTVTQ